MDIFKLFIQGGLVMYPLLLCSLVAIAILVERVRTYNQALTKIEMEGMLQEAVHHHHWEEVKAICEADGGSAATIIAYASKGKENIAYQEKLMESAAIAETGFLRKYLNYLEVIVTLAPLLGLLGTVTGMISSFSVLSVSEGQPFAITGGVGEALIATASGLLVAILALVIHTYLVQRQDDIITQIEDMSTAYMAEIGAKPYEA